MNKNTSLSLRDSREYFKTKEEIDGKRSRASPELFWDGIIC